MAGQMGGNRVKLINLQILKIIPEKNLILVKGAVPGANGSYVIIERWKLEVYKIKGAKTDRKKVTLDDAIFGIEPNDHAIYLDVKQYWPTSARERKLHWRNRWYPEVPRKLHKQKGTGGHVQGSIKIPLFRGGARVFGPHPRDYDFKLNKKLKKAGP